MADDLMALLPAGAFADPPHPGWGCCDPAQDLAGWLVRQRQAVDELLVASRAHRLHADRFRGVRLRADVSSAEFRDVDEAWRGASFYANACAEEAWHRFDRAGAIEAAHQFRLSGRPRMFEPPAPRLVPRRCARCGTERCEHFPDGAGFREVQGTLQLWQEVAGG